MMIARCPLCDGLYRPVVLTHAVGGLSIALSSYGRRYGRIAFTEMLINMYLYVPA